MNNEYDVKKVIEENAVLKERVEELEKKVTFNKDVLDANVRLIYEDMKRKDNINHLIFFTISSMFLIILSKISLVYKTDYSIFFVMIGFSIVSVGGLFICVCKEAVDLIRLIKMRKDRKENQDEN